jgi:hypothetical protein
MAHFRRLDVGRLMGAIKDRDRVLRQDGAKVMISLPVHARRKPAPGPLRRLFYRAEPARDWEPRLDDLWDRAKSWYPVAVARDADYALRKFAGHPTVRHHRFLVLPRFSDKAVAFAVFADEGSECCWLDLLWDHDHPGALELLIHISGRLAKQWGSGGERLCLAGDDAASELLTHRGFRIQEEPAHGVGTKALAGQLDAENTVGRAYLTAADLREIDR